MLFTEPAPGSFQNSLGSVHEASSPIEQVAIPPGNVAVASYVIGPMVVRVLPDGRPVPGTKMSITLCILLVILKLNISF